jgi:hypothetical protein
LAIVAFLSDLQILNELQHSLRLEGLEEVRLIKDKRTGMKTGYLYIHWLLIVTVSQVNPVALHLRSSLVFRKQDGSLIDIIHPYHFMAHTIPTMLPLQSLQKFG